MDRYALAADAVLLLHLAVVVFIVGGLLAIVIGAVTGWRWVRGWWFRVTHLAGIGVVVLQSWLGQLCPLTILESWLRTKAGLLPYDQSFIGHWVQALIYIEAPFWVFMLAYTAFGLTVVWAWWRFPPERRRAVR